MKNYKQTFVAFFTEKRRVLKIDASSDKKSSDKVTLTMLQCIKQNFPPRKFPELQNFPSKHVSFGQLHS